MSTATSDIATFKARLRQYQDAEDRGDRELARELREVLLADRLIERINNSGTAFLVADLELWRRFAFDLEQRSLHETAIKVYVALAIVCRQHERFQTELEIRIRGAHCAIALLDFTSAEEAIGEIEEDFRRFRSPDKATRNQLEAELHRVRARLRAATGALGDAIVEFEAAIVLAGRGSQTLDVAEMRIAVAELHIDRGDFAKFDALYAQHVGDPSAASARSKIALKWSALTGISKQLRGSLSDADDLFFRILENHDVDGRLERLVRWHRIQTLSVLNRLDEAERELSLIETDGTVENDEIRLMKALIQSRRAAPEASFSIVRTPKELATVARVGLDETELDVPPPQQAEKTGVPRRLFERCREQWSWSANLLQLHLHSNRIDQAVAALGWLVHWFASVDSPLMRTRLDHLRVLTGYYLALSIDDATARAAQLSSAFERAHTAMNGYVELGLATHQWSLHRLQRSIIMKLGLSEDQVSAWQEKARVVLRQINDGLAARDRIFFQLNKSTDLDDTLAAELENARQRTANIETTLQRIVRSSMWRVTDDAPVHELLGDGSATNAFSAIDLQRTLNSGDFIIERENRLEPKWLPNHLAVAYYVVLPDRVSLFLVTRSGCTLIEGKERTSRVDLASLVDRALAALRYLNTWKTDRRLVSLGQALHLEALLDALPKNVSRLVIVPDDALINVPFAALPVREKAFVQNLTLAMMPAWRWTPTKVERTKYATTLGISVENTRVQGDYEKLPGTAVHASLLLQLKSKKHLLLDGEAASRDSVLAHLGWAEAVHFACHGDFDIEAPYRSGLLLEDDRLTVVDLARCDLRKTKTVIIGACWSGNMTMLPGREMVGVPAAFLMRGASAVISPTWEMPLEDVGKFMHSLYTQLRERDPIDALATVQRDWLSTERTYLWAAYSTFVRGIPPRWWPRLLLRLSKWREARATTDR